MLDLLSRVCQAFEIPELRQEEASDLEESLMMAQAVHIVDFREQVVAAVVYLPATDLTSKA